MERYNVHGVLLRNYSSNLAKIKYWILIVLPLAYFLGQFQPLFLYIR
jgi:hypothetical protein